MRDQIHISYVYKLYLQASSSIIYFTKSLWPEFTFWQLLAGVFYYQRHYETMVGVKKSLQEYSDFVTDERVIDKLKQIKRTPKLDGAKPTVFSQRVTDFIEKFELRKYNQLVELSAI